MLITLAKARGGHRLDAMGRLSQYTAAIQGGDPEVELDEWAREREIIRLTPLAVVQPAQTSHHCSAAERERCVQSSGVD